MKYLRRIVILLLVVILLAAIIIGVGSIFALRNVNITLESYTYSDWDNMDDDARAKANAQIEEFRSEVLSKHGGSLMGFVGDEDIAACFEDSNYLFDGCERIYPCTINITLKERRETFVVAQEDGTFKTYDALGKFLPGDNDAVNNLDGAPNIYLRGVTDDEQVKEVASFAAYFADTFSALRSVVESIELPHHDNVIFTLRSGLKIDITGYADMPAEKIKASYAEYRQLTGDEKLSGQIITARDNEGKISAVYFPEGILN